MHTCVVCVVLLNVLRMASQFVHETLKPWQGRLRNPSKVAFPEVVGWLWSLALRPRGLEVAVGMAEVVLQALVPATKSWGRGSDLLSELILHAYVVATLCELRIVLSRKRPPRWA